jgi:predicted ATPase/class 3 adenylate cyclase
MRSEREQLETGIAAFEAQRGLLGDSLVDAALGPLRAKLAAIGGGPEAPSQRLKQVSILFLDVVGSTTLSQKLDPEAVSDVMDDVLARGTAIVEAHRGRVLQYAGDNLLAAFGVGESREDDPERAVRCGLDLLALGRKRGAEIEAMHSHVGFDVRVGIHTGGVLLGGGVDADGTIRGIAVNIAARMEQTAPAGTLRISHDTYAQVRGLFEVEVQEPLRVKGVDEPLQSYLVTKAKPRSFRIGTRGIEGVATKMIGRDAELEELQSSFRRLFVERRLAAITVTADAGIGKSRLLHEFEAWSEEQSEAFNIFQGRANPQTQGQPYGLLRDLFAWRLQIADDDTLEEARKKVEDGIAPLFLNEEGADLAEGHAHLLGHLIGIDWKESRHVKGIADDPKQIRNRAFHAAAQVFRRVSTSDGRPIVLQLEDLHWADSESLDFLAYLTEIDRDVPLLILAFSRPALFERRAAWCADDIHRRIDLTALDKRASRDLANELLKKLPEVPAALRELVTGGAEGNPFYMEELVKMLIDQGAIETRDGDGDRWRVNAERLIVTKVPSTLTGVLQARLDGLPVAERRTLQQASVIGSVFWDKALVALDGRAAETLPLVVIRELVLPRGDIGDDLREYAFKHAMLHQVTYAMVLKRDRRDLHGKLAHWLAAHTGLRANDFLGIAADHFEAAGDDANAAEFHTRAAEQAQQRLAHEFVHKHVARAHALLDSNPAIDDPALRWRLLVKRELTLHLEGNRVAQRLAIEGLERLAEQRDDDHWRAYAASRRAYLGMRTADWTMLIASAERAALLAKRAGDIELHLTATRMRAHAMLMQGEWDDGRRLLEAVRVEARAKGYLSVAGATLPSLAIAAELHGDLMLGLAYDKQFLTVCRASGNRGAEAHAQSNLGLGLLTVGDLNGARRELEEALQLIRANAERPIECMTLYGLGKVAHLMGDDARALTLVRAGLDLSIAVQGRREECEALCCMGIVELSLGRHEAALAAFDRGLARALEIGDPMQHDASAGRARVALARGDGDVALAAIEPLMTLDAATQRDSGILEGTIFARLIELTCHRVLDAIGDPRANDWLRRAHDTLQAQASRIDDVTLREGFITNIPHHGEIIATWEARRQRPTTAGR